MKLDIQKFAASYSTTFSEPALTDANITGNYSTLQVTIYFSANNSSTWFASKTLYCTVNGVGQSQDVRLNKGGSVTATFIFDNIPHDADGTKDVNWVWYINTGTSGIGTLNPSGTRTLQTIPRASQPTLSSSSIDLGNSVTITTNRVSNSFTHTIRYTYGSDSGTIASNVTDTTSWTPPVTLSSQTPNATSGTAVIYCDTYNGETFVGTKSVNITLNVPSSVVPSVSIGTLTEADTTMQGLNWGVFVQNKSKLNIPITAAGVYGSTISSIVTTINGLNFNGANVTTSTLVTSGNNTISTTVTDSRGRTKTTTKTYNVVAYSNPSITVAQVQRCLSDGTLSDEGTYLLYSFTGSISSVSNNNAKTFKLGYKKTTDANYTYLTLSTAYTINVSDVISSFTINQDYSYDVVFQAIDSFMTTEINKKVDTGFDLMNFNASGKAMAIGKVSEAGANEELLEIGVPVDITSPMYIKSSGNTILRTNTSGATVLSSAGQSTKDVWIRPNGDSDTSNQTRIDTNGAITQTSRGKYGSSYYDNNYYWVFDTDASEVRFNKQVFSDIGFYVGGSGGNVPRKDMLSNISLDDLGNNYPTGLYKVNATAGPFGATWYYVMQNKADDGTNDWMLQEAVQYWTNPIRKFFRLKMSGNWTNWQEIAMAPVVIYDSTTGIQSGNYITIDNITSYAKLQITFMVYGANASNQGGASNVIWLDLTKNVSNTCRCGVVVPYLADSITGSSMGTDFRAVFEANLSNNRLYCFFAYGTQKQTSSSYVMTKVVAYYRY